MIRRKSVGFAFGALSLFWPLFFFCGDSKDETIWWSALSVGSAPQRGTLSELRLVVKGPGVLWREGGPIVTVAPGCPPPKIFPPGEDITVVIENAHEKKAAGITLLYKPEDIPNLPEPLGRIQTDADGKARLRRLPGEALFVWIGPASYLPMITKVPPETISIKLPLVQAPQPVLRVTDPYGRELRGAHLAALPAKLLGNPIQLVLERKETTIDLHGDEVGRISLPKDIDNCVFAVNAPGGLMRAFSERPHDSRIVLSPALEMKIVANDASTRAPIQNATYLLSVAPDDLPWLVVKEEGVLANGSGRCFPSHYPFHIEVKGTGYIPVLQEVPEPPKSMTLQMSLKKGVQIAGIVVDERGNPVSGAIVSTGMSLKNPWSNSGKDGKFALPPVAPEDGPFTLRARAGGFTEALKGPIAAKDSACVRIVLDRGATVSGLAVDAETLQPVLGAHASIRGASSINGLLYEQEKETGADGSFVFAGIDPGNYDVKAWAANRTAKKVSFSVSKNEKLDAGVLTLSSHPVVKGKLLAPIGAELGPNPQVSLERILDFKNVVSCDSPKRLKGTITQDGDFRIEGVAQGHYRFAAEDGENRKVVESIAVADEDKDMGELRLEKSGSLSGQLAGKNEGGFEGWRIELLRQTFDLDPLTSFSGSDGHFNFEDLASGHYYLKVFRPLNLNPAAGQVLLVPPGKETEVTVLVGGVTLDVFLQVDGRPAAGASIAVAAAQGSFSDAGVVSVDSQYGKILVGLPPYSRSSIADLAGMAEVKDLQPGSGEAMLGYQGMAYELPVVIPSEPSEAATWNFKGLTLSGTVYSPEGTVAPNVTVSLAYDGVGVIPGTSARTNGSGDFVFAGLGEGNARVIAVAANGASASANVHLASESPLPNVVLHLVSP